MQTSKPRSNDGISKKETSSNDNRLSKILTFNDLTSTKQSKDIDKEIEKEKRERQKQANKQKTVLLVGPASAGKTTVLKQMKLRWRGSGLDDERNLYARFVQENLIGSLKRIIHAMETLPIEFANPESKVSANKFLEIEHETDLVQIHNQFLLDNIPKWMADVGFNNAIKRGNEYNLLDSAEYFLKNHARVLDERYTPTDDDILRVRHTTFKEDVITFNNIEDTGRDIIAIDLGGKFRQRKRWGDFFDNADMIVFLASVSCYNQTMEEDKSTNQMNDTLQAFREIISNKSLAHISVVLFLNKIDLFPAKYASHPISVYFPDYKPKEGHTYKDGLAFFEKKFRSVFNGVSTTELNNTETEDQTTRSVRRILQIHHTFATDQSQMKAIITALQDSLMQKVFQDIFDKTHTGEDEGCGCFGP